MALGVLNTLRYQNLNQFLEDINQNFAIIQNSPMFKGVPGQEGSQGKQGVAGERGSRIVLVYFNKFRENFDDITTGSQIDVVYLNSKLKTNNTEVIKSLGIDRLVDGDVVILTNRKLLSYSFKNNAFEDTGIILSNSITDDLNALIERLINEKFALLNSNKTLFSKYKTRAKSFNERNGTGINDLKLNPLFCPVLEGINPSGIDINNHFHYGLTEGTGKKDDSSTFVVGDMEKYYELLLNTVDPNNKLTSVYGPGAVNSASIVMLQDNYKNGLMFGYKGDKNTALYGFGSIFKNEFDEIELKSNTGIFSNDYSSLRINKNYLKYDKAVRFDNELFLKENLFIGFNKVSSGGFVKNGSGHILSSNFRSGSFVSPTPITFFEVNATNPKENIGFTQLGHPKIIGDNIKSKTQIFGDEINFYGYLNSVLVTGATGTLRKDYKIEKHEPRDYNNLGDDFSEIAMIPKMTGSELNSQIITSYYYNYLAKKINQIYFRHINGLYWTKKEFETGVIPKLKVYDKLEAGNVFSIPNIFSVDKNASKLQFNGNVVYVGSSDISFPNFMFNVLVCDDDGSLRRDIYVEEDYVDDVFNINPSEIRLINTKHYNDLLTKIKDTQNNLNNNYWTKTEFETGIIPNLKVGTKLESRKLTVNGFNIEPNGFVYVDSNRFEVKNPSKMVLLGWGNSAIGTTADGSLEKREWLNMDRGFFASDSALVNTINSLQWQHRTSVVTGFEILKIIEYIGVVVRDFNNKINTLKSSLETTINNNYITLNNKIEDVKLSLTTLDNSYKAFVRETNTKLTQHKGLLDSHTNQLTNHETRIVALESKIETKADVSRVEVLERKMNITEKLLARMIPIGTIAIWDNDKPIPVGWEEYSGFVGKAPIGVIRNITYNNQNINIITLMDEFLCGNYSEINMFSEVFYQMRVNPILAKRKEQKIKEAIGEFSYQSICEFTKNLGFIENYNGSYAIIYRIWTDPSYNTKIVKTIIEKVREAISDYKLNENGVTGGSYTILLSVSQLPNHNHFIFGTDNTARPLYGNSKEPSELANILNPKNDDINVCHTTDSSYPKQSGGIYPRKIQEHAETNIMSPYKTTRFIIFKGFPEIDYTTNKFK